MPDIVGNLRVDQAWGSAQIMGACIRSARATIPTATPGGSDTCSSAATWHTHRSAAIPSDKWGWAVGAGMTLKMPWDAKDTLSGQIAFAEGASKYVAFTYGNRSLHRDDGISIGAFNDAVFASGAAQTNGVGNSSGTDQDLGRYARFRALLDPKPAHLLGRRLPGSRVRDNAKQLLVNRWCGSLCRQPV